MADRKHPTPAPDPSMKPAPPPAPPRRRFLERRPAIRCPRCGSTEVRQKPDVDTALEQAWTNLYAKLDAITPIKPKLRGEAQAVAIIKGLAQELKGAASALHGIAEALKTRPNMTPTQRLQLANSTMLASRRARQAAESVLG